LLQKTSQKNGLKKPYLFAKFFVHKNLKKRCVFNRHKAIQLKKKILPDVLLQKQKSEKQYFFFNWETSLKQN